MTDLDAAVRVRAFGFLTEQRVRFGEASIPRTVLERGFDFEGARVPLIGPQGIFKPAILPEMPLTITTAPPAWSSFTTRSLSAGNSSAWNSSFRPSAIADATRWLSPVSMRNRCTPRRRRASRAASTSGRT